MDTETGKIAVQQVVSAVDAGKADQSSAMSSAERGIDDHVVGFGTV